MITKNVAKAIIHLVDNHKASAILVVITEDDRLMMRIENFMSKPDETKHLKGKMPEYRFFIHKGNGEGGE